ncbi:hypothetical protein Pyn_04308 [Prunus yedoensis var. nudiflora]|uniref:Uncharacterized protein n=1 Tax=Prunus yedoensis var. nudiflora TaxID=2094558 RepID=A0A314UH08_PRUYE|nr:hypothetical protein Pyn_04308 [Prunus yedoensis var. nudiflora]
MALKPGQNCSTSVYLISAITVEDLGTVTPNAHKRKRRRELRDTVPGREPELSENYMNNPNPYWRRKVSGGRQQHEIRDKSMDGGGACTRRVRAGTK